MKKFTILALVSASLLFSAASAGHSVGSGKAQFDAGDVSVGVTGFRAKGPATAVKGKGPASDLDFRAKGPATAVKGKGPAAPDAKATPMIIMAYRGK